MRYLAALLVFFWGTAALAGPSATLSVNIVPAAPVTVTQQIAVITQFTTTFPANTPDAAIGTPAVRMCPYPLDQTKSTCLLDMDSPKFAGTLSITGANACGFYLDSGGTVRANHATGCSATGGPHSNGVYDDWNVVASQSGVQVPTVSQPETVTAVPRSGST